MIIFLEATNMIIKRLEIKNLHGIYNYNVSFNDDLTFIFGENGCGKTTILDIVSSIVTGRLYNLFSYDFDEIVLSYRKATKRSKLEKIRIRALDDAYEVSLNNSEIQEVIEDIRRPDEMYSRENDEYAFERRFMSMYKSPRFLKDTFNYIYLPLSRNSQDGTDMMDSIAYRRRRSMLYSEKDIVNKNYLNDSLRYVEEIIRTGCMRITTTESYYCSKEAVIKFIRSFLKCTRNEAEAKIHFDAWQQSVRDGLGRLFVLFAIVKRHRPELPNVKLGTGKFLDENGCLIAEEYENYYQMVSQEIGSTDTHIEQIRERIHTQFNGNEDDKVLSVICGKYQFESLCRQLRGCCRKNINREIFRTVLISNFDIQHLSFLKDKILQLMADNLLESNSA